MQQVRQERPLKYEPMYQLRLLGDGMDEVILSLEARLRESAMELQWIREGWNEGNRVLA